MILDHSKILHLSFLLFSLYYFFHHHVNELLGQLYSPRVTPCWLTSTARHCGVDFAINNNLLRCPFTFHLFNLTITLLVNRLTTYYLLLTTHYLPLTPGGEYRIRTWRQARHLRDDPLFFSNFLSGGEYRIRTDDPLLAKQVL